MNKQRAQLIAKLKPICFFSLVAWGGVAQATITSSAVGGPAVNVGSNGSTVININKAGNGGVSHNIYTQFDVDKGGVVLNNSVANSTSQLAGNIAGNANLAGGSASIILNEVNSTKASQLNGMIEVTGQKAQVIVANPSGITCSGCGFINTERATLTTGKAQVANGTLLGYTVDKGTIIINGNGLKTGDSNYTDVISRAVQINADIRAKDLKVTTGRNNVNADNTQIGELTPSGVAPTLAIDVAKLGGMYANKITLVSTDRGIGVRNAGTIGAAVSDVNITTDGILENKGTIDAARDVNIDTTRGRNAGNGYYYAYGRALNNSANGTIKAAGNIKIDIAKSQLSNGGGNILTYGEDQGDINIVSAGIDNKYGNIQGVGVINTRLDPYAYGYVRTLSNSGGVISGKKGVVLSSSTLDNTSGMINSANGAVDINTAGYTLTNLNGTINAGKDLKLNTSILNNSSGLVQSQDNITINTNKQTLNNTKGAIRGSKNVFINSASLNNTAGRLLADNYLDINTNGGTITNAGLTKGAYDAELSSGLGGMTLIASTINNSYGKIASLGDIVTNTSSLLKNSYSLIDSDSNIVITTRSLDNTYGLIESAKDTVITADSIANSVGSIDADAQATLMLSGSYSHYGNLSGKQGVNINADKGYVYNYGTLTSNNGQTMVNTRSFYNQRGAVVNSPAGLHLVLATPGAFTNSGTIEGPITLKSVK
ncbi:MULTISPECIES: filamentous hemagglutinin N-terminal domain-containing protein [unclassified Serratia (in: enterobacteria)]|uniref:two-partner secretion domain-containing protein n=1 Tax=unclassified Serratia (in: enterobacteria) TaxID=2647522 RepID=UPI0018A951D3|nr:MULTISPECIES: filamentous hemagglutinin N-terminal domain-containing protein [unclassified Serratia (in: enterobacteria)]